MGASCSRRWRWIRRPSRPAPIAEPRASGHELTADGPVPVEPWTPRALRPGGQHVAVDGDRPACVRPLHLEDPSLAVVAGSMRRSGSMAGSMPGASAGRGSTGRAVPCGDGTASSAAARGPAARAGAPRRRRPAHQWRHRARAVPVALRRPDGAWFGISVPPLRLEPTPGAAGDLSRFAGVYAWPDRRGR